MLHNPYPALICLALSLLLTPRTTLAAGSDRDQPARHESKKIRKVWPPVTVRVGVVIVAGAVIRDAGRLHAKTLSTCAKGQRLSIDGQGSRFFRVVMHGRVPGYILRKDVRLLQYLAVVDEPPGLGGRLCATALGYRGKSMQRSQRGAGSFIQAIYGVQHLRLPSELWDQAAVGYAVPKEQIKQWRPGDRLYFSMRRRTLDAAALYLGGGRIILPWGASRRVSVRSYTSFYARHLVSVVRSSELVIGTSLDGSSDPRRYRRLPPPPSVLRISRWFCDRAVSLETVNL